LAICGYNELEKIDLEAFKDSAKWFIDPSQLMNRPPIGYFGAPFKDK